MRTPTPITRTLIVALALLVGAAANALPPTHGKPDPTSASAGQALGAPGFAVKETADLKLARSPVAGELLLAPAGFAANDALRAPSVTVSRSLDAGKAVDLAAVSKRHLAEPGDLSEPSIFREGPLEISGLPGHEIFATATTRQGVPVMIYQVLASDGQYVYRIHGRVGANDQDRYLFQFRSIAASLTLAR